MGTVFEILSMSKRKKQMYLKLAAVSLLLLILLRETYLKILPGDSLVHDDKIRIKMGRSQAREVLGARQVFSEECPIPHLKPKLMLAGSSTRSVSCKRLRPVKDSCQIANKIFRHGSTETSRGCPSDEIVTPDYCKISGQGHSYIVTCNTTACETNLEVGTINTETGSYFWRKVKNKHDLEAAMRELINKPHSGFCLIKCQNGELDYHDYGRLDSAQYLYDSFSNKPQLLNLPPYLDFQLINKTKNPNKFINFNLIFIDSVSRHHFIRSLPRTVQLFERTLKQHTRSKFSNKSHFVLDFELMQGIRSRTYESLQALFAGIVNPFEKPFSTLAMPPVPLKTEILLDPLRELGYKTLWLEDLCYLWEWGISKDLLVHDKELTQEETWKKLQRALNKAGIDSLGNTYANCEILRHNGVNDHFHGPDKVCYNSKHQHLYTLEYLRMYQDMMHSVGQPYFTFYETNIGHEDSGVRIQDFDVDFVEYLKFLKSQDNTMTIIFSDHGNAYGNFMEKSQEARIELFHPFLFLIIPEGVRNILDSSNLRSLISNQDKLVSLLDLHYTLTHSISKMQNLHRGRNHKHLFTVSKFNKQFNVTRKGLLDNIQESRTCSQIPRINPNLCICEGYETTIAYSPYYFILALYAVGELNNHIQAQRRHGLTDKDGGFGRCQRLVVEEVANIRESRSQGDSKIVKMDIHVLSPFKNTTEIFFVTIETPTIHHHKQIQLTKFERITSYSQFKTCADQGIDLQLCVCDINRSVRGFLKFKPQLKPHVYNTTEVQKSVLEIDGQMCLHVILQSHDKGGVILEAYNTCKQRLSMEITLESSNLILSTERHFSVETYPNDVIFLTSGLIENEKKEISWSVKTAYQIL